MGVCEGVKGILLRNDLELTNDDRKIVATEAWDRLGSNPISYF